MLSDLEAAACREPSLEAKAGGQSYVGRSSSLSSRIWFNPVMGNASMLGLTLAKCRGDLLQWNLTEPCKDRRGTEFSQLCS